MALLDETALLLEGGAMRAVATAPVVVKFIEENVIFPHVSGISAGCTHMCNYLSKDTWRTRAAFIDLASDPQMGGVKTLLQGKGAFNAEYIYQHTSREGEALPYDWDTFVKQPTRFRICALRARDGEEIMWTNEDIHSIDDLLIRVQASSTMPLIMPMPEVEGEKYVDGALGKSGGIPLQAAQADGYERFMVIMTQPRDYIKTPSGQMNRAIMRMYFRKYPAVYRALEERARNYNRTRAQLFELEAAGKAYLYFPKHEVCSNHERNVEKLTRIFDDGTAQINAEWPSIRAFLGLNG
ncbi:patatin-like phospholipase family protein [Actinotignum urinale]|uniref:Patatin family protein n=1 Tax=Actinotignum urinale TaxID=190146 RepID=A0AAW9HXX3_9ACTO|nr:patatin family protein [Actinotignum urinale]MDY5155085.1 patatin family protein [Actinotignum urinale]